MGESNLRRQRRAVSGQRRVTHRESSLSRLEREAEGKPWGERLLDGEAGKKNTGRNRDRELKREKMIRSSREKGEKCTRRWDPLFSDLQIFKSASRENPQKACCGYK